jgi:hypothetical protein
MAEPKRRILDEEMILNIVKKIEDIDAVIEILEYSIGPASERGENWSSSLLRCQFQQNIIKMQPFSYESFKRRFSVQVSFVICGISSFRTASFEFSDKKSIFDWIIDILDNLFL